jgi:prepilin-type N-terminal cleavage/methylation domain-containing protein/prepilin-type processing-associated H-X9-DG protein
MRKAFTLIELLIVIFLIGLLIAMATPAILGARSASRRATCENHHHELMLAVAGFEQAKGRYPGWREEPKKNKYVSWAFQLLPYLSRQDLHQHYGPGGPAAAESPREQVEFFLCPEDFGLHSSAPTSIAVNCGVQDVPNDHGQYDLTANGIFHDLRIPNGGLGRALVQFRGTDLADGARNTITISDRTEAERWTDFASEKKVAIWWRNSADPPSECLLNGVKPPLATSININHVRPSSGHPGGVTASFADGHTQFLSEEIDYAVYVQLMTPNGARSKLPDGGAVLPELRNAAIPEGTLEQ